MKQIKAFLLLVLIYTPMSYANDAFTQKVGASFTQGDVIGGASGHLAMVLNIIIYCVGAVSLFVGFKSIKDGVDKAKQPDGGIGDVLNGAGVAALVIGFGVVVIFMGTHYTGSIAAIKISTST